MKKKTEYLITKWERNGSSFGFSDEKEAKKKFEEMKKLLRSNEKLVVSKIDSERLELNW